MQNLVYDFETLMGCSQNLSVAYSNLQNIRSDLKNIGDSADEFWKGEGRNAYSERCEELIKTLDRLSEAVNTNKQKLDKAIEIQSANEALIETQVNNLSADNIF